MYGAYINLGLGWNHLNQAKEQAMTGVLLKQSTRINVWLLSLSSGALDSKSESKHTDTGFQFVPITGLRDFMAMDQVFTKAREEGLKQKDRMGAIKTQDRVQRTYFLSSHCLPTSAHRFIIY